MGRAIRTVRSRGLLALGAAIACVLAICAGPAPVLAAQSTYQIYPTPHAVEYADGEQTLRGKAKVLVEDGVDKDTVKRLDEALALKNISASNIEAVPTDKATTAVLVGIKGSGGAVDAYVQKLRDAGTITYEDDLFDKNDAYLLASIPSGGNGPDVTVVLGTSTDAAYYGLTTLYQILQQVEGTKLQAFTLQDYADVITRGFIEGYYGEPWSTEDRVALMEWGGYYKLNAYVYAPKDDPKHNSKWRELYTEEELANKIEPLANAGNASKCRFVFALHPFMSNPITSSNYDETVAILKKKFTQVMDHGVRAISILADDAANQGAALYTRLLEDMTAWLREQQAATNEDGSLKYEGLKDTIIFCPPNYMGYGEAWYANLPANVQVVNTGGRVWGKVEKSFVDAFRNNSGGTGPFMWVNWPCSDNDKDALHMGGHNSFLGADVEPGSVKGVVLNPMQQSEPSKVGIFLNADFSWNLWTSTEHADQAWADAFSYVDHNSPVETKGSNALRALSEHMLRIKGGGTVFENNESANIKDVLVAFQASLNAGNVTQDQVDELTRIFEDLRDAAKAYRSGAGNPRMLKQVTPWIDTWDDLTRAALADLDALSADLSGNSSVVVTKYAEGKAAYEESRTNGFSYIDHTEYAQVGKMYIVPMMNALDTYLTNRVTEMTDPDAVITRFVTNRPDAPYAGTPDLVYDGNVNTGVEYHTPAAVTQGTYFGITKSKPFDMDRVTITMGTGKNYVQYAKLQVTNNGADWVDVEGQGNISNQMTIDIKDLGLKGIYGVRIVATRDNDRDSWPTINEIEINRVDKDPGEGDVSTVVLSDSLTIYSGNLANVTDGNTSTVLWVRSNNGGGNIRAGEGVTVLYAAPVQANRLTFAQGNDNITSGTIEYATSADVGNEGAWVKAGTVNADGEQGFNIPETQIWGVRVTATENTNKWWKIAEVGYEYVKPEQGNILTNIPDVALVAQPGEGSVTLSDGDVSFAGGQYLALDLGSMRNDVTVRTDGMSLPANTSFVYSQNGLEWHSVEADGKIAARYVGVMANGAATVAFKGFSVGYKVINGPSTVSSDLGNFNATPVFDGNVSTTFKSTSGPASVGAKLVFDLGQERTINSIAYYVPETSYDFIRNAVVEVASSADAPDDQWAEVLKINGDTIVDNVFSEDKAKEAAWLTHDSTNPGNMYTANPKTDATQGNENDPNGTDKLDVTGRYVRVRFTGVFTQRWVEIGELRINGGEYVSTYADADIETKSVETPGHGPASLIDGDTATYWETEEAAGSLTYHVSKPLADDGSPYRGVRIVSQGTPSGATVSATVYTDATYENTTEVKLGTLDQSVSEFTFGEVTRAQNISFTAVKDITVTWNGAAPKISEMFTLASADTADMTKLEARYNELKDTDTSGWTATSAADFASALATAGNTLEGTNATQAHVDSVLSALETAYAAAQQRYTDDVLSKLVADHISNDDGAYSAASYQAYQDAFKDAEAALADPDNLSVQTGEGLVRALEEAIEGLAYDTTAAERAEQAIEDATALYGGGSYTAASVQALDAAIAELEKLVADPASTPAQITAGIAALEQAEGGLVDVSALVAARAEFEALENIEAYTKDSYQAYKDAYDASTAVLENGSAEDVAAAVTALAQAREALELAPEFDLAALIEDAERLNAEDYTTASWKVLETALEAARADHDPSKDPELGQALVDAMAKLVNVSALKQAIARAEAIDTKPYTEASVAALNTALATARAELENGSNESVDAVRIALLAAIDGLERVDGGSGSGSGTSAGGSSGTSTTGGSGSSGALPGTGDQSLVAVATTAGAAVAALAAGAYLHVRRKRS